MASIKPAEVSKILKQQLEGIQIGKELEEINEGDIVKRTGRIASIGVGDGLLGRVVSPTGQPLDGKGPIGGKLYNLPFERKAPGVIFRQPVKQPLQTRIQTHSCEIPIGRGQRELIIGDRRTGET